MRRNGMRILALALFLLLVPQFALAGFNHYSVDVDALKALEATDTFDARIIRKTVTDSVGSTLYNDDNLTLTVENSGSLAVTGFVVIMVCYDDEHKAVDISNNGLQINTGTEKRRLHTSEVEDLHIGPGETYEMNIRCEHSQFTGVRALIAQATFEGGRSRENPLYPEWQELALGSPTHYLD